MVLVAPEAHFIARLDAELVAKFLRDDDLTLRPDAVSHTTEYNLWGRSHRRAVAGVGSLGIPDRPHLVLAVSSDRFAGVERYLSYVAPRLAAERCRVTVIGGEASRMRRELAGSPVTFHEASSAAEVAATLRRVRPVDLVHAHMTDADVAAVLTKPLLRAPVVSTRHFRARRGRAPLQRLVFGQLHRFIDCQIAISAHVAAAVEGKSVLLLNGVPDEPAAELDEKIVLVAQRFEREKDTSTAIRAWERSGLGAEGWRLVVAGTGQEEVELRDVVAGAASVELIGQRDDLPEWRQRAAIFLATAPAEPFGLSVVEAMAAGLPVVAANGGGHRETVGAVAAEWLYPPGDAAGCAAMLRRLAGSRELRRDYGRRLREHQRAQLSVSAHVEGLWRIYRGILSGG